MFEGSAFSQTGMDPYGFGAVSVMPLLEKIFQRHRRALDAR